MKGVVEVYLYGSLGMSQGQSRKSQLPSALQAPTPLMIEHRLIERMIGLIKKEAERRVGII
jgi:hypothetical protein